MSGAAISLAIRHPALIRVAGVKIVWVYLASNLPLQTQQPIKITRTAATIGIKRRTMRRALRSLVRYRYLDCVVAPTAGTPGEYVFGPRAYGKPVRSVPRPNGVQQGPRPDDEQLPLLPWAS